MLNTLRTLLQSLTSCRTLLQSLTSCRTLLQSLTSCRTLLQSLTSCRTLLQSLTSCRTLLQNNLSWSEQWERTMWGTSVAAFTQPHVRSRYSQFCLVNNPIAWLKNNKIAIVNFVITVHRQCPSVSENWLIIRVVRSKRSFFLLCLKTSFSSDVDDG